MYNTQDIANRIKDKVRVKGFSLKQMLLDLKLGVNLISQLAKGQSISSISLAEIADYLDCSVDYLLGRTEVQKKSAESDKQPQRLYDIFNNLNDDGKAKLLEYAAMMESSGMFRVNVLPFAARTTNDTIELVTDINDTEVPPPDTI